ncbi:tyrosine-type recombinase/integrase [Nocardia terpenica]|uniref:tyrosine-type recombinase/integrase n=1 Tax=Nocardia terpenica TaxID=455432 RepID=UPI00189501E9|nr:tyrosine-type recombinase/integrase [Nocardia terpenica]MBF6060570.1 tyrosine-type recombinase/integrase [Nocardia terpenica]MBF6103830.1 tyrosine-type recombinase/integrase [Nocardia terpenica]MBF6111796.1 tyrosine-type recombinase/integrase [Nocardia terpenica]MBF6118051.1 tyrosine-type recombinase/integrase [Nocardia terpenica]MBF6155223.1 tyrosine-type recombinase/integrase [Nocardia terpenica]
MRSNALAPGDRPNDRELKGRMQKVGKLYVLDRIAFRTSNGVVVRPTGKGNTQADCIADWHRRADENEQKTTIRKRPSKRKLFAPTDSVRDGFVYFLEEKEKLFLAGKISENTYLYYCRAISQTERSKKSNNIYKLDKEFGDLTIEQADNPPDIADYLDEVAEVKPGVAQQHYITLQAFFNLMRLCRALTSNPMDLVPRPEGNNPEPRMIEADERSGIWLMFQARVQETGIRSTYIFLYFLLLLGTGMRPGEGLAVRWCDISNLDKDRAVLHVCGTIAWSKDKGTVRQPKRKRGPNYYVLLPTWLTSALRAEYERVQPKEETTLILLPPDGGKMVGRKPNERLLRELKSDSEYEWFNWGHCRDTVATHIDEVAEDPTRASAQLGHSGGKESTAQRYYIVKGRKRVVVDNADDLEALDPRKAGVKLE